VIIDSSSCLPRRTRKAPTWLSTNSNNALENSCDLAMNRTGRGSSTPTNQWSMVEKWLGARITGPCAGTRPISCTLSR
jgi:hypothetical protein